MFFAKSFLIFGFFAIGVRSSGLYFPAGNIQLTIPIPKPKYNERSHLYPLVIFNALPVTATGNFTYSYSFTGSKLLQLNPANGSLTFSPLFYEHQQNGPLEIVGTVSASDKSAPKQANVTTRVEIKVDVENEPTDCDYILKDLCFWNSITYQLYENRPPTKIGHLRSPIMHVLCPERQVSYQLVNGTDELSLKQFDSIWMLYSAKSFDRDIERDHASGGKKKTGDGSDLYFSVRCTVNSSSGTKHDLDKVLRLSILDENDNMPRPQSAADSVDVHLSDTDTDDSLQEKLNEINNKYLIFVDKDSHPVNNYNVKLLNDRLKLFRVKLKTWIDDRHGEHQTIVFFNVSAVKNARSRIPEMYTIMLHINDNTLLPEYGDSVTNLTIRFTTATSENLAEDLNQSPNILYPEKATIFRSAAPLARVSQARDKKLATAKKFRLIRDSSEDKSGHRAFNVTVKEGIIYVHNITSLRIASNPVTLQVQWKNVTTNETLSDIIYVYLEMESVPTCLNLSSSIGDWPHCALTTSKKVCEDMCGFGTGGQSSVKKHKDGGFQKRCVWRGDKRFDKTMPLTTLYSTCTPDTTTCPDHKCDALEELHPKICPQDCTSSIYWAGSLNPKTDRGILKGRGACHCDSVFKCYCGASTSDSSQGKTTTPASSTSSTSPATTSETVVVPELEFQKIVTNISRRTSDENTATAAMLACGTPCVIGIAGGAIFLLTALAAVVACWRMSPGAKDPRRDRKYPASASAINSDYIDRSGDPVTPDGLLLNFDMNASVNVGYVAPRINNLVDAKWEFPREKLRIEQTLGEGEFGRVLRAKALEIAGLPGYTTVAVKTLKEDARDTEMNDLISEYQLLKEVSHPNVIRLLGASTLPGGPFYLIIEFAEHGSLRTYLRRSRHLEAEGRTPNTSRALMPGENEQSSSVQPTYKITPRDILCFAWQISRGMAYLNDMKLVHRDLAARNVLIADGMVCKISDFGLTRDVYEDDTYLKRTKGRVPVKWMAPESLADHIYNSKSDVWSFGILLWELVTLGASPYPGVAVQNLFHLLKSGYRMERPDNCSNALYKIMRNCWEHEPGARSSFRNLVTKFESMLADGSDYLDLNPNVVHNRTYFTNISDDNVLYNDESDSTPGYGNLTLMQPDTVLWKRPESPIATNRPYENETKTCQLNGYETPIKIRRTDSVTLTQTQSQKSPNKDRPQSYIDMAGTALQESPLLAKNKSTSTKQLNYCEVETVSKITSL